ncbi:hypothetical protein V6N13_121578 [Hibiscus sabdariffa]
MLASGQVPNMVACSVLLDGLCKTGKLEEALKLFQAMRNNGLELDIVPYNILINGLCKARHIDVAKELFHKLLINGVKPNVYTYTIMINGLHKERMADEAHQLFKSMRDKDCVPDSCCYNVMIQGLLRNSYTLKATQYLTEMVDNGFSANICTATLFLDLIIRSDKSIMTKQVQSIAIGSHIAPLYVAGFTRLDDSHDVLNCNSKVDCVSPLPPIKWCIWTKPEIGWIKLNTDGSVRDGNSSIGGLFRDYKGEPLCAFFAKTPHENTFVVELTAIWRGLHLALNLGIRAIWIESDSLSAVKTINGDQPGGLTSGCYLSEIRKLLGNFEGYRVSHSWREANKAADYISRMDVGLKEAVFWPLDFPDMLHDIIMDDAQGSVYFRQ